MKMILGKKIGMTQCFYENGQIVPATIIYVEPNLVIENKTKDKHGYDATKVGVFTTEEKKMIKPEKGVFDKLKLEPKKLIREFRDVTGYKVGDKITADIFAVGENVDAQALTKGKGFTGAIKRWNFATGPKSHGAGFPHRFQGSISFGRGGSQGQRVMKGKKMSGHMGCELVTISNLLVIKLELDKNLILVKGSIPGPNNSIVILKSSKKKNRNTSEIKVYDLLTKNNSNASSQKVEDIKNESSNLSQENIEHANVATSQEQRPIETNLVEENTINNQQEKLKENVETVSAEVSNSESNQNVETVSAEVSNSESNQNVETVSAEVSNSESNQNVESNENSSSSTSGETEKENKENSGE